MRPPAWFYPCILFVLAMIVWLFSQTPPSPARLPESLYKTNYIKNMAPGEAGWTVPWALTVAPNGQTYIDKSFDVEAQPGGTAQMLVQRVPEGIVVTVPKDYRYDTTNNLSNPDLIPVIKVQIGDNIYNKP